MGDKRIGRKIPSEFWMKIAKIELKRAEDAFNRGDYPDCVFHSQQAVEKMAKALLELNQIIVRDHYVADKLKDIVNVEELIKSVRWFEEDKKWETSRYPIEKVEEILMPDEIFDREIAVEALNKANFVVSEIEKVLKEKYGLNLEEGK
jgi:HEPN domain-containing protein